MQYCTLQFTSPICHLFSQFYSSRISQSLVEDRTEVASSSGCANNNGTTWFLTLFKYIVHFIFLLDTVQSVLVMDDLFYWFVYHFNDYSSLGHFNFAVVDGPFLDAIIMFTVQTVYCWRVWKLGHWRFLPAVAVAASFSQQWSLNS